MTNELPEDPNVRNRWIGRELSRLRKDAELTQRGAATASNLSLSKLIRIENGTNRVSVNDLNTLLALYGRAGTEQAEALTEAARGGRGKSWWSDYQDIVSPQFGRLLGYEGMASEFVVSHPFLVPGLLQTREYAAGLHEAFPEDSGSDRTIELRLKRQERLFSQADVQFTFILGEESLSRWIGGPGAMRRQLEHLLETGRAENVSVRIVPFTARSHPGLLTPFSLLRFGALDDALLYIEGVNGDKFIRDDQSQAARYQTYIEKMKRGAAAGERGEALLRDHIERLRRAEAESPDGNG